jgi:uncharacterized membrane protein YgcG
VPTDRRIACGCALVLAGALMLPGLSAQEREEPSSTAATAAQSSPYPSLAGERVRYFEAQLRLQEDGSLEVREQITVWSEGRQIVRGIYRDLATRRFDLWAGSLEADFQILSSTLGGQPIRHQTEDQGDGLRIYLGDPAKPLPPGQHQFELSYRISDQLLADADGSRLYWNVTGNGWSLPIDSVQVELLVPQALLGQERGLHALRLAAYAGPAGATASGFDASIRDGAIWLQTTAPLAAGEGFTIDIGLPLAAAASSSTLWQRLSAGHHFGLIGALLLWAYFLAAWLRVGRDPPAGRELLVRRLPPGQTPATLRLVERMAHDPRCFVADLLQLAVEGRIRLSEAHGVIQAERIDTADDLPVPLRKLHGRLFQDREQVALARSERSRLQAAVEAHRKALMISSEGIHFRSNIRYWLPGLLIAVLSVLVLVLLLDNGEARAIGLFMTVWLSGWSVGVYILLSQAVLQWRSARHWGHHLGALFISAFSVPFVIGELVGLGMFASVAGLAGMLILLSTLVAVIAFHHWLKAPTAAGRQLLDQIDSLRAYLRKSGTLGESLEESEALLPSAFALDVGDEFAEGLQQRFGAALASAGRPWFRPAAVGSGLGAASWSALTSDLGSQLQGAIAQATRSKSSSGSGGSGGSSGGGGGGRGGGGW